MLCYLILVIWHTRNVLERHDVIFLQQDIILLLQYTYLIMLEFQSIYISLSKAKTLPSKICNAKNGPEPQINLLT